MSFGSSSGFSRFGGIAQHHDEKRYVLKKMEAEGKIKFYDDEKKETGKVEIIAEKGKVVFYKDYLPSPAGVGFLERIKKIDIFSSDDELRDTLFVITDDKTMMHPIYQFSQGNMVLGRGKGDIVMAIAYHLLGDVIDSRFILGSAVDEEVLTTIKKLIEGKTI
ncbi:MAG: hypothetical protein AAB553_02320 [Patescibacteria group bacterium]